MTTGRTEVAIFLGVFAMFVAGLFYKPLLLLLVGVLLIIALLAFLLFMSHPGNTSTRSKHVPAAEQSLLRSMLQGPNSGGNSGGGKKREDSAKPPSDVQTTLLMIVAIIGFFFLLFS